MSSEEQDLSNDDDDDDDLLDDEEEEWEPLSEADLALYEYVRQNDAAFVRQVLRNGANVNCGSDGDYVTSPLEEACHKGYDEIVRILLDAGANVWWSHCHGRSATSAAIEGGHLSTLEMLLNHDNGLLEIVNLNGKTPLLTAISSRKFGIVRFLLDRGANPLATTPDNGWTSLMYACDDDADLRLVRQLLAAGVAVEGRNEMSYTALHAAANRGNIETMRVLIAEHNANMFAAEEYGETPFDLATRSNSASEKHALLIECSVTN